MDKDTQLWNEYQNLHGEIMTADSLNYQIIGVIVAAVAAILTAGFNQGDPTLRFFVFLCAYVVTIPGYRLLQGNRRRIWRISTYMRVFLESQLEFMKWLSRLDAQGKLTLRESEKQSFSSLVGQNEWFIISMMNSLAALAAIFGGLLQVKTTLDIQAGGMIVVILLNLWILITTSR